MGIVINLLSSLFSILIGILAIFLLVYIVVTLLRQAYEEHKYYVQHVKPGQDAFRREVMQDFKANLKQICQEFKKVWVEYRGNKPTP